MTHFGPEVVLNNPAYIDPTARLHGRITIGEGSSLWPYVVVRAEVFEVRVGAYTNIQDFVMVHIGYGSPTIVGDYCSITHHCTIHGCTIGDNCLIGIAATIMDDCVIGDNCIVAGHTFLKEGTVVPDNSIVMGVPGRVVKTRNAFIENRLNAVLYHRNALAYAVGHHRAWTDVADLESETQSINREFARRYGAAL